MLQKERRRYRALLIVSHPSHTLTSVTAEVSKVLCNDFGVMVSGTWFDLRFPLSEGNRYLLVGHMTRGEKCDALCFVYLHHKEYAMHASTKSLIRQYGYNLITIAEEEQLDTMIRKAIIETLKRCTFD